MQENQVSVVRSRQLLAYQSLMKMNLSASQVAEELNINAAHTVVLERQSSPSPAAHVCACLSEGIHAGVYMCWQFATSQHQKEKRKR
eukprot:m.254571 g.254571  ORF g.254571 m.254571 type:complete len:87 (-) comp18205_c0_seq1:113-373(-)